MVGWFVGWTEQIEVNQGTYPLKIYKKTVSGDIHTCWQWIINSYVDIKSISFSFIRGLRVKSVLLNIVQKFKSSSDLTEHQQTPFVWALHSKCSDTSNAQSDNESKTSIAAPQSRLKSSRRAYLSLPTRRPVLSAPEPT